MSELIRSWDGCEPNSLFSGNDASSSSNKTKQRVTSLTKRYYGHWNEGWMRYAWLSHTVNRVKCIRWTRNLFFAGQKKKLLTAIYRCKQTETMSSKWKKTWFLGVWYGQHCVSTWSGYCANSPPFSTSILQFRKRFEIGSDCCLDVICFEIGANAAARTCRNASHPVWKMCACTVCADSEWALLTLS